MTTMTEPQRLSQPSYADVTPERPPYLWAGLVSLGALVLYVLTLAPTTQFWDTSEYIAAAYVLGIPHPPGNPLFVLIAHRSEEHTSELQSQSNLVCRLLLEKKKKKC